MSELEGLWETELKGVVRRVRAGGAVRTVDHTGHEIVVRVKPINPARLGYIEQWA